MRQEKLEYFQKKYESRLNPSRDVGAAGAKGGGPGMGHGPGRGGRRGTRIGPGGKPKNVKKTLGRLLGYISEIGRASCRERV